MKPKSPKKSDCNPRTQKEFEQQYTAKLVGQNQWSLRQLQAVTL